MGDTQPASSEIALLARLLASVDDAAPSLADRLLAEFGSLSAVLAASGPNLSQHVGPDAADTLVAVRRAMLHVARFEALTAPILSSVDALIAYLKLDMAHEPVERFRVLYLNSQNLLLCETVAAGTIDEAPVYPREIMRRSLEAGATALLLIHNHPSGDHSPSAGDIRATRQIVEAGRHLAVTVHDHLVISKTGWSSFRKLGLL